MSGGWVELYWDCDASEWRYALYRVQPRPPCGWNDVVEIPEATYIFLDKAAKVYADAQGLIEDMSRDCQRDRRRER